MEELFVEKVKLKPDGNFLSSVLVVATAERIAEFKSKPCNHSMNVDKLIYDVEGWPYYARHCGVCKSFIGEV